jgi:Ti-type conjugative transfer relaxase TraA
MAMTSPEASFRLGAEGATAKLTLSQAHFSEKEFIRLVAESAQGEGLYAADIIERSREHLSQSQDIVRLGVHFGEPRYTTRAMLTLEESLLGACEELSRQDGHSIPAELAMGALVHLGELSLEQTQAVWHVTVETEGLAVVSGMAGAGKTRMLEAAVDAWESAGKTVIGGALAARAAKELESGADVDSRTLARLFQQIESGALQLTPNHVLVIDEAGMVATPETERLGRLCLESGCKLVLVGDERQLQPIGPGAPFRELGERYGQAELKEIRRQEEEWARQAVQDFADGRAEEALGAFIQRGLLKIAESKQEAIQLLVQDWSTDGLRPKDTMLIAGTRADVAELNEAAQQSRLSKGEIGGEPIQFSSGVFFVGDRVMFTKAYPVLGVVNGDRGYLESYDSERGSASVRLDDGSRVGFEAGVMHHLHLGYASTGHKGQGATTVRSYVLAGGAMQDREMSYVQASRARERTTFYLPGDGSGVEVEQLIRDMARSRQKDLAVSLLSEEQSRQNEIER